MLPILLVVPAMLFSNSLAASQDTEPPQIRVYVSFSDSDAGRLTESYFRRALRQLDDVKLVENDLDAEYTIHTLTLPVDANPPAQPNLYAISLNVHKNHDHRWWGQFNLKKALHAFDIVLMKENIGEDTRQKFITLVEGTLDSFEGARYYLDHQLQVVGTDRFATACEHTIATIDARYFQSDRDIERQVRESFERAKKSREKSIPKKDKTP